MSASYSLFNTNQLESEWRQWIFIKKSINFSAFSSLFFVQTNDNDAIHVITVSEQVINEKPPEYDTVVLEPPCYDDAIKLSPANLLQTKQYQDISLPNYNDLGAAIQSNSNGQTTNNNTFTVITIDETSPNAVNDCSSTSITSKPTEDSPASNPSGLS